MEISLNTLTAYSNLYYCLALHEQTREKQQGVSHPSTQPAVLHACTCIAALLLLRLDIANARTNDALPCYVPVIYLLYCYKQRE